MAHDIFISYASEDKPTADAVCATMEDKGIRCWYAPRDALAGKAYGASIMDAIAGSRVLVLVFSSSANKSPYVEREVERAVHYGLHIVTLRIEDTPFTSFMEYFLSTPHWLDALTPPLERHLAFLADAVQKLLSAERSGQAQALAQEETPPPHDRDENAKVAPRGQAERVRDKTWEPVPIPIPGQDFTFVDREAERDTLRHLLSQGNMRFIVVVAPSGHGKSELVTKVLLDIVRGGNRIIDPHVHGILYLRCKNNPLSLGRIFAEAGRIVGQAEKFQQTHARRESSLEHKLEFFFGELRKAGNVWIILDNLEDQLNADSSFSDPELCQFIEFAVTSEHTVRLVATTRAVPSFKGSHRLKPLDLTAGLPEHMCVEYLRVEGASCGLADADEQVLRAVANRVHRIPLALNSIVGYLSANEVPLAELLNNETLFADFDRYDKENGLKRLIAEQFEQQPPEAKLALCAISVFFTPAPLAGLQHVLPDLAWQTVLPRLVQNRLLNRQPNYHYELHRLVQEHAYAQLPESGDESKRAYHYRAGKFYMGVADGLQRKRRSEVLNKRSQLQDAMVTWDFQEQVEWVDAAGQAFEHFYRSEAWDEVRCGSRIFGFYLAKGRWGHEHECAAICQRMLTAMQSIQDEAEEAEWLHVWAVSNNVTGNYVIAERACRQGLEVLARKKQETLLKAHFLHRLARIFQEQGNYQEAKQLYEASASLKEKLGESIEAEGTRAQLLDIIEEEGNLAHALEVHTKLLEKGRGMRHRLARLLNKMGEYARSEAVTLEGLQIARRNREPGGMARFLQELGVTAIASGRYHAAKEAFGESLSLARKAGKWDYSIWTLSRLGVAHHHLGDLSEARRCYSEALASGLPPMNHQAAVKLGILCMADDERQQANDFFAQAITICQALLENTPRLYDALYHLAVAQLCIGQLDAALANYRQALQVCSAKGVVADAVQNLKFIEQTRPAMAGLAEVHYLLEEPINE